jgi:hypothetical protein
MKNFDGDSNIQTTPVFLFIFQHHFLLLKYFSYMIIILPFQLIIQKFKHYMLYELFALWDNKGTLPSVYVQTIDD